MLANKEFLDKIFQYIGSRLNHEVEALLIGGNAMVFYGLRGNTKDVDLVLYKREDLSAIIRIIKSHPLYKEQEVFAEIPYNYRKELKDAHKPTLIGKGDVPRFDLFYKDIFSIGTEAIFNRAKKVLRYDLLVIRMIEPEDLIILKAATERPQDKEDIQRLIKELEINWDKFLESLDEMGERVAFFVLDTLNEIEGVPKRVREKIASWFELKL